LQIEPFILSYILITAHSQFDNHLSRQAQRDLRENLLKADSLTQNKT
jgi:hypothetical protein